MGNLTVMVYLELVRAKGPVTTYKIIMGLIIHLAFAIFSDVLDYNTINGHSLIMHCQFFKDYWIFFKGRWIFGGLLVRLFLFLIRFFLIMPVSAKWIWCYHTL